jgi:hypothetical protein
MYANMSPDFLKTYAHSKQEEFLKEAQEHILSQQVLARLKAQKESKGTGRVSPASNWLSFKRQHI